MDITLKQMHYADVLSQTLNFRKAAEACYITQPALSEQIHLLEEQLGVRLFERNRRSVSLTRIGEAFVDKARLILNEARTLEQQTRTLGTPFAMPIMLGAIPTIAPYLLPRLMASLRRSIADLQIFLREEPTDSLLDKIRNGHLDMAILASTFKPRGFEVHPLYQEEFVLVVEKNHPFRKRETIQYSEISNESILLLEDEHCLSHQALEVCHMAGARANMEFRASSMNTLVQMVANGLGVTLLPQMAIDVEIRRNPSLIAIPFETPPGREICLAWRTGAAREAEYTELKTRLATTIRKRFQNAFG